MALLHFTASGSCSSQKRQCAIPAFGNWPKFMQTASVRKLCGLPGVKFLVKAKCSFHIDPCILYVNYLDAFNFENDFLSSVCFVPIVPDF